MLNFYKINRDGEIRTRDRLVIKGLILYQRTNSTQKLKLLGDISIYDLYFLKYLINLSIKLNYMFILQIKFKK
jgi:hypothetical protein